MENNVFSELPLLLRRCPVPRNCWESSRSRLPPRSLRRTSAGWEAASTSSPQHSASWPPRDRRGLPKDKANTPPPRHRKKSAIGKYQTISKRGYSTEKEAWEAMREADRDRVVRISPARSPNFSRMVRRRRTISRCHDVAELETVGTCATNATPPPELVEELRRVRASANTTTLNSTTAARGDGPT